VRSVGARRTIAQGLTQPKTSEKEQQTMQTYTLTPTDLERYFAGFAQGLAHAPGAAHLTELAATAKAIPESLLADLTAKMAQLDPAIIASVLAVRAREIAFDGLRYDDPTDFARALDAELRSFLAEPEVMAEALAELERRERGSLH
jgi:hypothetical protein